MGVRGFTWVALVALTLFTSTPAWAQAGDEASRAEARKIGYAGVEAYQAGDFATAHERLETAYQLLQVPSLGLWSARALAKLGKLVEADARYQEVIRLPTSVGDEAIQEQARRDAGNERGALVRRIPSILVRVEGAPISDVTVTIDDAVVAGSALSENQPVNPGPHRVEGVRGTTRVRVEIKVAEGERREAALRFAPPGPPASSGGSDAGLVVERRGASPGSDKLMAVSRWRTMRTVGWVTVGVGGAALAVGAFSGLMAMSKRNDLDTIGCGDGSTCPPSQRGNVDSYNNLRIVSGVGLIVGAALAGVGAYLVLTAPPDKLVVWPEASRRRPRSTISNVRLAVGLGGTVLSGEF